MATDAQKINLVLLQQALICRAVRNVACGASFDFCFMLVNKRPLLFGVAFVANLPACRVRPELLGASGTVRTVTVIALDQSLIYTVAEWKRANSARTFM